MNCSTPGFPVLHHLQDLAQTQVHRVNDAINHLILCRSLFIQIRWSKYWSFSFSISPSKEYSRLISFRIDWLDLLAVQGTLRVFSNTIVQKHQFFDAQLSLWSNSHPYMITGKTIALTIQLDFNLLQSPSD